MPKYLVRSDKEKIENNCESWWQEENEEREFVEVG